MLKEHVEIIDSLMSLPEVSRASSLADLLFRPTATEDDTAPIIMGTVGHRGLDVSLRSLRCVTLELIGRLGEFGLHTGDTVCLIRLPRTSETIAAAAYIALSAAGMRVLFPMYLEPDSYAQWLSDTGVKAVLWSARALLDLNKNEADHVLFDRLSAITADLGVRTLCFDDDLELSTRLYEPTTASPALDDPRLSHFLAATNIDTECLILTTSGTSGRSKLVRYLQGAFLRSCASWELAGLYHPTRLGGRGLCLLLAHSMGLRALWNTIWTRQAMCLIPPEWFLEHPERVQALLQHMRPEHLTGGPAVYRTLLELARVFPQLKESCLRELRCAVSSGASFDNATARRLEGALGVKLENAFGMTETMQVLTTLVDGPFESGMGNPLPGVRLALQPYEAVGRPLHRLYVQSPFGFVGYLGDDDCNYGGAMGRGWFDTGDLVERTESGLFHAGRESQDFIKDGFGVKVARALILERYAELGAPVEYIEVFPMREEPGLAALVFVNAEPVHDQPLTDRRLLRTIKTLLEARLERFHRDLDDFEIRHLTIARFVCISDPVPRTAKGNIAHADIGQRYAPIVNQLVGFHVEKPGFVRLDRERLLRSSRTQFTKPRQGELLRIAKLDKPFESATGDRMSYSEYGVDHVVVDMVGGFGSTLLGHNHPDVVEAARQYLTGSGIPLADQGSARRGEGEFARRLAFAVSRHTGSSYVVHLGSTGAEVVEMALAHAFLEYRNRLLHFVRDQKRNYGHLAADRVSAVEDRVNQVLRDQPLLVLTIEGSYHGASLGARSVLGRERSRVIFEPLLSLKQAPLPPDGDVDLEAIVTAADFTLPALTQENGRLTETSAHFSRILAAIAEPIRGEGGVAEVSTGLLKRLSGYVFPLILDEIQCGLGRSGSFLASDGIRGDYYLLGKSLGGGVSKISALLIDRERYIDIFDEHYASTFAGDEFSCSVADRVLDVIERDEIASHAEARGRTLRERLEAVQRTYPDVIRAIKGRGLMLGIELDPACTQESYILRTLTHYEHLGMMAASYLLNRHSVRILPTISAWNVLRVEPSAYIDDEAIEQLAQGLAHLCDALRRRDGFALLAHLVEEDLALGDPAPANEDLPLFSPTIEPPAPGAVRVAFLNHFLYPERELAFVDPTFLQMPPSARRALFQRLVQLMDLKASLLFARNLFGGQVWFASVILPVNAAILEELHRSGKHALIVERIQQALDWSASMGCEAAGLGAYTSILTADGTALLTPPGVHLTTGNALTVAVGVRRILQRCDQHGLDPDTASTHLAVVGASGNIGAAIAHQALFGVRPFRKLTLVGRNLDRLHALRESLLDQWLTLNAGLGWVPDLSVAVEMSSLRTCNVIIAAAGTTDLLIDAHHLPAEGPVIIADLSVPSVVSTQAASMPHVDDWSFAGTACVSGTPDFAMASHIAPGSAFCCAAELMLLGLAAAQTAGLKLIGDIDPYNVRFLDQLAQEHGFYGQVGQFDASRVPS